MTIMSSKMSAQDEDEHIRQMFLAFDMQCKTNHCVVTCIVLTIVYCVAQPFHWPFSRFTTQTLIHSKVDHGSFIYSSTQEFYHLLLDPVVN